MLLSEHFICPSVQFLSAGRFVSRNGTPHPRRCLPETVLLTGFAGEMSIRQEEREYTLRRGEYLLLQPQRIHVGTAPVSDGQSHFWCHFLPQTPPALPEYGQLPEPERFFVLFRQLIDTAYRGELSPPLRQSLCDRYTEASWLPPTPPFRRRTPITASGRCWCKPSGNGSRKTAGGTCLCSGAPPLFSITPIT